MRRITGRHQDINLKSCSHDESFPVSAKKSCQSRVQPPLFVNKSRVPVVREDGHPAPVLENSCGLLPSKKLFLYNVWRVVVSCVPVPVGSTAWMPPGPRTRKLHAKLFSDILKIKTQHPLWAARLGLRLPSLWFSLMCMTDVQWPVEPTVFDNKPLDFYFVPHLTIYEENIFLVDLGVLNESDNRSLHCAAARGSTLHHITTLPHWQAGVRGWAWLSAL